MNTTDPHGQQAETLKPAAEIMVFLDPADKDAECWRVQLDGVILGASWNSKGAALAGAQVELRRLQRRAPASSAQADVPLLTAEMAKDVIAILTQIPTWMPVEGIPQSDGSACRSAMDAIASGRAVAVPASRAAQRKEGA